MHIQKPIDPTIRQKLADVSIQPTSTKALTVLQDPKTTVADLQALDVFKHFSATELQSLVQLDPAARQKLTVELPKPAPLEKGRLSHLMAGDAYLSGAQVFAKLGSATTAKDVLALHADYNVIAKSYARATAEEFFQSPAALKSLTPKQQTAVKKAFETLTTQVASHFAPDGVVNVDKPGLKERALAQHANYVAGELTREFPKLTQEFVRNAITEFFNTGGDVPTLTAKLEAAGGPPPSYFNNNNGYLLCSGVDDKGTWSHWGFGALDVALNLPGVYGGDATLSFAESLQPGKGKELLHDALTSLFWERTPEQAMVVEFCMRSSQAGWLVSKVGQGIVEANKGLKAEAAAPAGDGKALADAQKRQQSAVKRVQHHDIMSFDALKTEKGWPEMVKDTDQTRAFAVQQGILGPKEAEPKPLEEAMLHVLSRGLFTKDEAGALVLSKHGQFLRAHLQAEAKASLAQPEFDVRNETQAKAFGLPAAAQAGRAIGLDGAKFPALFQLFHEAALGGGDEIHAGKGAGGAGNHALAAMIKFSDNAIPLVGQTQPLDVFKMVTADLGFEAIPKDGPALKADWQFLLKHGVIEGYGSERVDPASTKNGGLQGGDQNTVNVGLRLAQVAWAGCQPELTFQKPESKRIERPVYDLFDNHKLETYKRTVATLDAKPELKLHTDRVHELAVGLTAFEVYKDLFQLSDAVAEKLAHAT